MNGLSVFAAAREAPRALALVDGSRELSFADLAERVRGHVQDLASTATSARLPAPWVAVSTAHSALAIELILTLFELGITVLPVHARLTPLERERLLSDLPVTTYLDTAGGNLSVERLEPACSGSEQSELRGAAALATSGSSGEPRVALLSQRAFLASARASAQNLGWREDDRWLLCLPLAHVGGLSVVTRCLLARRPVVLVSEATAEPSAIRIARAIDAGRATLLSVVPAQLDALLSLDGFTLPRHVRALLTGGAALSKRLLHVCADRGWPLLTTYGLTEACSQVATQRPGTENRGGLGSGPPLPGVDVRVRDGVVEISGPSLFSGYLGRQYTPGVDAEGWFRTGDLGRFDDAGNLHVLGRHDDVIISGGENISPREVESVLEACPGVREACVFGVPDPRFGQVVAAALRIDAVCPDLVVTVDRECRQKLANYKRPRLYASATAFVYGKTGKLDRHATASALLAQLRPVSDEISV